MSGKSGTASCDPVRFEFERDLHAATLVSTRRRSHVSRQARARVSRIACAHGEQARLFRRFQIPIALAIRYRPSRFIGEVQQRRTVIEEGPAIGGQTKPRPFSYEEIDTQLVFRLFVRAASLKASCAIVARLPGCCHSARIIV